MNRKEKLIELIEARKVRLQELKMPEINKYGRYVHRAVRRATDRGARRAEQIGVATQSPETLRKPAPAGPAGTSDERRRESEAGAAAAAAREKALGLKPGESPSPEESREMDAKAGRSFARSRRRAFRGSLGGIRSQGRMYGSGSGYGRELDMRSKEEQEAKQTGIGRALERSGLGLVHDAGRGLKRLAVRGIAGIER